MAYTSAPSSFFGAGYSLASSEVKLTSTTNAGTTLGTFTVVAGTDVITVSAAHNLHVGEVVRVSSGTTLPAGMAAATDYFVKTVPSTTTLTVSATLGGATLDITDTGTGTHTMVAMGALREVTDTEANATTGDWRKVLYGIMEMIYQKWTNTVTADRPAKIAISRSSSINNTTGNITYTYTVRITVAPGTLEVAAE